MSSESSSKTPTKIFKKVKYSSRIPLITIYYFFLTFILTLIQRVFNTAPIDPDWRYLGGRISAIPKFIAKTLFISLCCRKKYSLCTWTTESGYRAYLSCQNTVIVKPDLIVNREIENIQILNFTILHTSYTSTYFLLSSNVNSKK